jgi:transcriptional regulator with XRE-family HTH domain
MSKRTALPAAIKAIREAKAEADPKYRGSTFAATCLMSHAHLCNIEAGRKSVTEDVIHRIAAHLGVPVDAISYVTETEAAA